MDFFSEIAFLFQFFVLLWLCSICIEIMDVLTFAMYVLCVVGDVGIAFGVSWIAFEVESIFLLLVFGDDGVDYIEDGLFELLDGHY